MDCHSWIANQDLVEFVRQGRTVERPKSVTILYVIKFTVAYENKLGLSVFIVQCRPEASNCGYGCSRTLPHKCNNSFEIGQSSIQISFFLYSSTKCGCFSNAKPCPIRFVFSSSASYRLLFFGLEEPPVSSSVSPACNIKGISQVS